MTNTYPPRDNVVAFPAAHPTDTSPTVMLTVEETARTLRIGRTKVYELLKDGSLGSLTIGRRRLVPALEVQRFTDALLETSMTAS